MDSEDNKSFNPHCYCLPPSQLLCVHIFYEFSSYLENIVMCPEPLVIAGDSNFHTDLVHSKAAVTFNELLETFCLSQHVSVPTRNAWGIKCFTFTTNVFVSLKRKDTIITSEYLSFEHNFLRGLLVHALTLSRPRSSPLTSKIAWR